MASEPRKAPGGPPSGTKKTGVLGNLGYDPYGGGPGRAGPRSVRRAAPPRSAVVVLPDRPVREEPPESYRAAEPPRHGRGRTMQIAVAAAAFILFFASMAASWAQHEDAASEPSLEADAQDALSALVSSDALAADGGGPGRLDAGRLADAKSGVLALELGLDGPFAVELADLGEYPGSLELSRKAGTAIVRGSPGESDPSWTASMHVLVVYPDGSARPALLSLTVWEGA